jgi:5-methylcytosine-specific restriction endonuclease McrA
MATERKIKNQGMNWISQHKRLSIYLRDGLACAYCGSSIEDGTQLTLDHIQPYSLGGSNHETNLVTCCQKCNSSRGNRDIVAFADATAGYLNHGLKGSDIMAHINNCISRKLDTKAAKELVERRGSCFQVLKNGGK